MSFFPDTPRCVILSFMTRAIPVFLSWVFLWVSFLNPPEATAEPDLDKRIGQMIMVGFRGLVLTEDHPIVEDILKQRIGGVVLFDYDVPTRSYGRNIDSESQITNLTSFLQKKAFIPLLVAIDQEGGQVNRLKEFYGFPPTVSQRLLGLSNLPQQTLDAAEKTAALLSKTGINLNLAPVVDLDINPRNPVIGRLERSFGKDPSIVIQHAMATIEGHRRHGVLTTLKHFPGHGSSEGDTQKGHVDVTKQWSPIELEPFRHIVRQGKADCIMTAHLFNRRLDLKWPATLSALTITGVLRGEIGFEGVVISDDLQMKAITDRYTPEAGIKRAILAGVDILVFANNSVYEEAAAARAVHTIKEMIRKGELSENRINVSWRRIMTLKERLGKKSERRLAHLPFT